MDAVRVPKKPRRLTEPPPPTTATYHHPLLTEIGKNVYESIQKSQMNVPPVDVLEAFLIAYMNPGSIVDMSLLDKPLLMSLIGPISENIRLGDIRQCMGVYFRNDFRDSVTEFARLVKYVYDSLTRNNLIAPPSTPPASPHVPPPYSPAPSTKSTTASAPGGPSSFTQDFESSSTSRRVSVKRSQNGKVLIGYKGWGVKRVQCNVDKGLWNATFELDMDEEEEDDTDGSAPKNERPHMSIRKVDFDCKEWGDSLAKSKAEAYEFKIDRGCQANQDPPPAAPVLPSTGNLTASGKTSASASEPTPRLRTYTRRLKSVQEWAPPPTDRNICASCGSVVNDDGCNSADSSARALKTTRPWHFVELFSNFFY